MCSSGTGCGSDISASDLELVQKLRQNVSDVLCGAYDTDYNLLRWTHGWNDDIGTAEEKLRNFLRLRKILNLDGDPQNFAIHPLYWKHYCGSSFTHTNGKGNLIPYIMALGQVDIAGMAKTFTGTEFLTSILGHGEINLRVLQKKEAETGHYHQLITIVDMEGAQYNTSLWNALNGVGGHTANVCFESFPEITSQIFIINAGMLINAAWKVIEPWLPKRTKAKIKFLGSSWKTDLHKWFSPESLPLHWGGTMVEDGDPCCSRYVLNPQKISHDSFSEPNSPTNKYGLDEVTLGRRDRKLITIEHTSGGRPILKWIIVCPNGAVKFTFYYHARYIYHAERWNNYPTDSCAFQQSEACLFQGVCKDKREWTATCFAPGSLDEADTSRTRYGETSQEAMS